MARALRVEALFGMATSDALQSTVLPIGAQ
jgi:hypothetical protein